MSGLHHVTSIAGNAARNLDFYSHTLGLRLVKKTVNFDDPGSYHFYYGDERGRPGTILTFFPWEHAAPGRNGVGQTHQTAFAVPTRAVGYWTQRLIEKGVKHESLEKRFGESVLAFTDPDGTRLALIGVPAEEGAAGWSNGEIPAENAILALHGVTLLLDDGARTGAILTDVLGLSEAGREGSVIRYRAPGGERGAVVDIHEAKGFPAASLGRGSVHHIAFRAADDSVQAAMGRKLVRDHGLRPTEQKDRNYFRSIYFREPGGVLFEIATDIPGFDIDEPLQSLGTTLKLPAAFEPHRERIEKALPPLEVAA